MAPECPECGRKLTKRRPNYLRNVRRREIENVHDRYVCKNCTETFSEDEIAERGKKVNLNMKKWMVDL